MSALTWRYDINGRMFEQPDTSEMFMPVRCSHCGHGVYDLGAVKVLARYADCSVWRTPCCKRQTDDRPDWNSGRKCYTELPRGQQ